MRVLSPPSIAGQVASLAVMRVKLRPKQPIARVIRYVPHDPHPKQEEFLRLVCREAFYGGAVGGGKSDALFMAALQYVHVPGYAAMLFRRTMQDLTLPGALLSRAHEWLRGTDAVWNEQRKMYTFPSSATLSFGYLENERDKYRYQGSELQFIGFDELTQFVESQYRYLFSRLRRLEGVNVPLRMRSASNPGGIGHEWVERRFIIEGPEHERVFIPAKLDDNPSLDRASYIESLRELDPVTLRQLLDGDWSARAGGTKFRREWFEIVDAIPAGSRAVRYWDMQAAEPRPGTDPDWTCGVRMVRGPDDVLYITDVKRVRATPNGTDALIKQTAALDGLETRVYMEQEPGASGLRLIDYYRRKVLMGFIFDGHRATGSKELRALPLSSQAQASNVKLLRGPWISAFLDEIDAFPTGAHDDQVDAASGAFDKLIDRKVVLGTGTEELPRQAHAAGMRERSF